MPHINSGEEKKTSGSHPSVKPVWDYVITAIFFLFVCFFKLRLLLIMLYEMIPNKSLDVQLCSK